MGNVHSEGAVPREREAVEAQRKDREDERAGRGSGPGQDEQPRAPPALEPGADSQDREGDTNPQRGLGDDPAPVPGAATDAKVKPSQGKKRKAAKAQKWASGQVAFQEPAEDEPVGERLQPPGRAEQGGAPSSKPGAELPRAVPPPGRGEGPDCQPGSLRPGVPDPTDPRPPKAGTGSADKGQGEPTGASLQPLPPTSQDKGGKKDQLPKAPQGERGPPTAQGSQGATSGKESPCKLIRRSTVQPPPGPAVDRGPQVQGGPQVGKPSPPAMGSEAQSRPDKAKVRGNTPTRVKWALGPGPEPGPCPGRLRTYSFLTKRGAPVNPGPPPPQLDPPLPAGAKAAPGARKGVLAGISYAEVLKQGPPLAGPREHAVLPAGGGQGPRPEPQAQDSACKRKLPFYEQLIASLKSQAQRQRGSKAQRPSPGPGPEGPAMAQAQAPQEDPSPGPALPRPEPQAEAEPPPAPRPPWPGEAQAKGSFAPRPQPAPREEAEVDAGASLPPQGPAAGPPPAAGAQPRPQLPSPAQDWFESGASRPCPPPEQLPLRPGLEGQSRGLAKPVACTGAQPQGQRLPRPAAPAQPPAQDKAALQQQQKLLQPQASPKAQLPPEPRAQPNPPAPAPAPAPAQPRLAARRPPRQEQQPPRAPAQASARPQARRAAPPCPAGAGAGVGGPRPGQGPGAGAGGPRPRPAGRWAQFQVDRTCSRRCRCRHRPEQLPGNVRAWTNSVREPFCESPWVRTAVLAGTLVAGTKFCMDHFKANNILN